MKKTFLSLFLMLVMCTTAFSQADYNPNIRPSVGPVATSNSEVITATWSAMTASTNALSRSGCVAITVNDTTHIYQFGGGSGAQYVSMIRYNVRTNTWSANALNGSPIPAIPFNMSAASAVSFGDSVIYIFGGESTGGLGKTIKYNVKTNTYTTMANMTTLVTDAGVVKYGQYVFVVGGGPGTFGTGYFNTVQVYNTLTNTYASGGTYPVAAGMMGIGIYGDTIITAGGWDGTVAIANSYKGIINPATQQVTWTAIAAYPAGAITRMASGFVKKGNGGGVAFSGGAIGGSTLTGNTYLYDMCSNTWNTLTANSTPRSNMKGAVVGDSALYVVAGFTTVGVGNTDRLTFSQIDGSCFAPPTPTGNDSTLVMFHDTTVATGQVKRLSDRDSVMKYIPGMISKYKTFYFNQTTDLPNLANYKTIILVETSFDNSGALAMGPAARTSLKTWLASGTPTNKKALISIGGDQAYNYDRTGSANIDTAFSRGVCGFIYRVDQGTPAATGGDITGLYAQDLNNVRTMVAPTGTGNTGYWPDGVSLAPGSGSVAVYKYNGHTASDTLGGTSVNNANYFTVTSFQDPRYFTGGVRPWLLALITYAKANGGTITNVTTPVSSIADKYQLSQNYPNPFNPTTKISFAIPQNGFVSLKVYDVTGKEVLTLVNKNMTVGSYSVDFNGALLSSGVYFYRLESGNFVETKKMMLVK